VSGSSLNLAPREERGYNLEGGILLLLYKVMTLLYCAEKRILLRFIETMYLIDEQYRVRLAKNCCFCLFNCLLTSFTPNALRLAEKWPFKMLAIIPARVVSPPGDP
jgi:hypothetical protein